jgi:hypothetical protein
MAASTAEATIPNDKIAVQQQSVASGPASAAVPSSVPGDQANPYPYAYSIPPPDGIVPVSQSALQQPGHGSYLAQQHRHVVDQAHEVPGSYGRPPPGQAHEVLGSYTQPQQLYGSEAAAELPGRH